MSDAKHTPTPYRIEPFLDGADDGGSVDEGYSLMAEGFDEPLAIIGLTTYRYHVRYRADYSGEEKKSSLETETANANFILKACNSHDELVEACEDAALCLVACEAHLLAFRETGAEFELDLEFVHNVGTAARAILAKVKDIP